MAPGNSLWAKAASEEHDFYLHKEKGGRSIEVQMSLSGKRERTRHTIMISDIISVNLEMKLNTTGATCTISTI